jgi:hypothetical protein
VTGSTRWHAELSFRTNVMDSALLTQLGSNPDHLAHRQWAGTTEVMQISQVRGQASPDCLCSLELGCAERQGMHLARYLKSLGCEVRVWGHLGPGFVAEQCNDAGIPWAIRRFRGPCWRTSLFRDGRRIGRALRRERPDVILTCTKWANVSCGFTWRGAPAEICSGGDGILTGWPVMRWTVSPVVVSRLSPI